MNGIDVSYAQGLIDWEQVAADNINFAMIKASQGHALYSNSYLFADRYFALNITAASKNGIQCGVYHYLTAETKADAAVEAEYFCKVIAPYKSKIKLWAAVDVEEDRYLSDDRETLTAVADTFYSRVQSAGFDAMVYTNPNYLTYRLGDISKRNLWLALWRDKANVPKGYDIMKIWQYGSGSVRGINGAVDCNLGYFQPD